MFKELFSKPKKLLEPKEVKALFKIDTEQQIPPLSYKEKKEEINIKYPLIAPYAYAHIYWDEVAKELIYKVEEPELNPKEKKTLALIEEGIKELINVSFMKMQEGTKLIEFLEKNIQVLLTELGIKISQDSYLKIVYYIYRDFVGLNEIEPFLCDYFIEDIECNGMGSPIYVVHRVYRNVKTNVIYNEVPKLASFVEKLAQKCGRYISYASPLLDGSLPDGSLDYNEPFIYKENGIVRISKIGKAIDKFYDNEKSNIPIKIKNIEVPSFDPKTLKINWKKVDYVYRHKINEPLYKLKLEFGREITLTGAHSIFKLTKEGIKAEKTSEIQEEDYLAIPLTIPENDILKEFNLAKELATSEYYKKLVIEAIPFNIFINKKLVIKKYLNKNYKHPYQAYYELREKRILPIKLWYLLPEKILRKCKIKTTSPIRIPTFLKVNKELLRLLGYYIAEGWTTNIGPHKKIQFCLNKKEKDYIEDIKDCFKKCFFIGSYIEPVYKNAVKITINSLLIWLVFNNILKVSHYAKEKRVPEIVFNVNKELQKEFIKGWHNGDLGSTSSFNLATDISYLSLFNNNIVPFYDRNRVSQIDNRLIKSHEYYTNSFRRNVNNNYYSMIPLEIFNPLNETHLRFRNKRLNRNRLQKIINEIRFKRFENINEVISEKFLKEWGKRGFLNKNELTEKGTDVVKEINIIKNLINSDLGFIKVKKIERVNSNNSFVYDVSVKGHENFVGGIGGVCCHNSRVNATYTTDISSRGPTFTLRKFTKSPWSPTKLIEMGTVSPEILAYLWLLIEHESNIMVIGGTGSGKCVVGNTPIYLSNGKRINIKDLVETKFKTNKIKHNDGWEFVEDNNTTILSLDKDLKISKKPVRLFWRHKSPNKLIKITTRSGRSIITTLEHPFFKCQDGKLIKIRADELTNKERIAVPRFLSFYKEYNNENLMDYLKNEKEIYVYNNFTKINEIYNLLEKKYNLKRINLAKKLGYNARTFLSWSKNNNIPFSEYTRLLQEANLILKENLFLKAKTTGIKCRIPKINPELFRFLALIIGDGHLTKTYVELHNSNVNLLKEFLKLGENLFDIKGKIKYPKGRVSKAIICSSILCKILNKLFQIPYGNKAKIVAAPDLLFSQDEKCISEFLSGIIDCEAYISKNSIELSSVSEKLSYDISTLFLRLGVLSSVIRRSNHFRINIYGYNNINKLSSQIYLREENKLKSLNELLNRNLIHKTVNLDVTPNLSNIICSIREGIGITQEQLAQNIGVSRRLVGMWENGLRNPTFSTLNKLTSSVEAPELKLLSQSDIFWDEVVDVIMLKNHNEKYVYDLTVDDTHNFIAGDIPLIVHNTTMLNGLAFFIPPQARVVSIEDTKELMLERENWLPSIARAGVGLGNIIGQKYGEVSLFDLLKESFRQRPDYVIVGEVRGSIQGDEEIFIVDNGITKRISIKELEFMDISKIKVLTIDKNLKVKLSKINKFIKHHSRDNLMEIETRTGKKVIVSKDHSLFTSDGCKIIPIETKNLKVGSQIVIPDKIPYGYNNLEHLNLTELYPNLRLVNVQGIVKKCINKIGQEKSNKLLNSSCARQYCRRSIITNIPINKFKILTEVAKYKFDFNDSSLKVTNGKGNPLSAKIPINEDFCRLLGYYIAEGSFIERGVVITNSNPKIIRDVIEISQKLFNLTPKIKKIKGWGSSNHIIIQNTNLRKLIEDLCGRTINKRVPAIIYGLSKKKICAFLKGAYSGDGSFYRNEIDFSTKLKKLAEDISYLLLTLNIVSRISKAKERLYRIRFKRIEDAKKFIDEVGFVQKTPQIIQKGPMHNWVNKVKLNQQDFNYLKLPRKFRHLRRFKCCSKYYLNKVANELNLNNYIGNFARGDFYLDEIKSMKNLNCKDKFVYDLSINPTQSFIGGFGGVTLHNSEAYVLFQGMASIQGDEEIFIINNNHLKRIPIKELENKDLTKIKALTIDPDTNEIKALPIKGFFKHPSRKVLYKIKTESGKEITTTKDHSVFTYTDKIIPKEVNELKKGDIIAVVNVKNKINNSKLKGEKIIEIKKINLTNPEPVYDISIPGYRNFVSSTGILLHNSGHPSFGTMHAEDVQTMIRRLETNPINLSPSLVESMDVVCVMAQVKYKGRPVRRLTSISEIIKISEKLGEGDINMPFIWDPRTDQFYFKTDSIILNKIMKQSGMTKAQLYGEFEKRTKLLMALYQNKIFDFKQIQAVINEYYVSPEKVLKKYGII